MKNYFKHLVMNWKVSAHALKDVIAHFVHGLIPVVKVKHHQPTEERKRLYVKNSNE